MCVGEKVEKRKTKGLGHIAELSERSRTVGSEETIESPVSTEMVCLRGLVTY